MSIIKGIVHVQKKEQIWVSLKTRYKNVLIQQYIELFYIYRNKSHKAQENRNTKHKGLREYKA